MISTLQRLTGSSGPCGDGSSSCTPRCSCSTSAPGASRSPPRSVPDPPADGPPRLHVRPAPRRRRRPHRGDRQHDPQAHAGRPAAGRRGPLLLARPLDDRRRPVGPDRALSAGLVSDIPALREVGSLIGTTVSATFLLVIGFINLVVLVDIYRMFRRVSRGWRVRRGRRSRTSSRTAACSPGCSGRCSGSSARAGTCTRSGCCSASGFDTASEVALLGLAATSGANHVPIALHPDPARPLRGRHVARRRDGRVLMLGAYGWAYVKPIRKLYYNLNITLVSVLIAFVIGGIEILSIVGERFGLTRRLLGLVGGLDFGIIGFGDHRPSSSSAGASRPSSTAGAATTTCRCGPRPRRAGPALRRRSRVPLGRRRAGPRPAKLAGGVAPNQPDVDASRVPVRCTEDVHSVELAGL